MPTGEELTAMGRSNEELVKAGVLLAADGLHPTSKGTRVSIADGRATDTDGPFTETMELIAGFTMIQASSLDEALEWVRCWPQEDAPSVVEVRQVFEPEAFEPEDFEPEAFGDAFTPELREQEERMRSEVQRAGELSTPLRVPFRGTGVPRVDP
ncbi:MAG: YciI family protein [Actinomycetales bacterium]|nr:YciI family protein [Actinomycetales bacterium]